MLSIRHAARTRRLLLLNRLTGLGPSPSSAGPRFSSTDTGGASTSPLSEEHESSEFGTREFVASFREWFQWGNSTVPSRIFEILSADNGPDHSASDQALSLLNIRLSEPFVLDVLRDGKRRPSGVLLCLRFFDWAGRQPQFFHTRATFHAMFKILSKGKQGSEMMEFLEDIERNSYKLRFRDTLVMGYALAGKLDVALSLFGEMRFNGLDLDSYAYLVLLNALVENNCFDAFGVLKKQVSARGLDDAFLHSITVKSLCKRNQLDQATEYLDGLLREGKELDSHLVGSLVAALCERKKFEQAHKFIEEFRKLGVARMDDIYSIWLRELFRAGKLSSAFEFFKSKKESEGYIPDVFRYNMLIYKYLRKDRVKDVLELLVEMKDNKIQPDSGTIDVTICCFCKLGWVDEALELYNSSSNSIFSPNCMFYNFLINALCGTKSTDEAYRIWKTSIASGYFPGKKSFGILTDALFRQNKLNEMMELVVAALERNFVPSTSTYDKFVVALSKARKIEEVFEFYQEVSKNPIFGQRSSSFIHLINALTGSNRGDMAATLLIDMQKSGHSVRRSLYKSVIQCLLTMDDPMTKVLTLLGQQLSYSGPRKWVFEFFISAAGDAEKPELAREVYEIMKRSGISPNVSADLLVLKSYLKSRRISAALNFYADIGQRTEIKRRLYSTMITGLCDALKTDLALEFFDEMRKKGLIPSIECYEFLVRRLCNDKRFDDAVKIVDDFTKSGRRITSFIGNTLLLHSLYTQKLYESWLHTGDEMSALGRLIGASSGRITIVFDHVGDVEEEISQCFPPDRYTYNILLRILSRSKDGTSVIECFDWMRERGVEPNQWTYDIIIHGLLKQKRRVEAEQWYKEMSQKGFTPTKSTMLLLKHTQILNMSSQFW